MGESTVAERVRGERPADDAGTEPLTAWQRFSLGFVHTVMAGLLGVLSLRGLWVFGRVFGTLEWLINYRRRRRFGEAMKVMLGRRPTTAERRKATREFFCRSRCDRMFYLIVDCLPVERARTLFSITNEALLKSSLARGHGVYMALSHNGPHHVAAMLFAMCGYRVAGVRDRREGPLRRYMQERIDRRHRGFERMRVLFADGYPREIFRCFEEGYVVGSAMDISRVRDPKQKMEQVTMFGQPQLFLSGPLRVAVRCGAPVLQGMLVPDTGFRYRLEILERLIDPETCGDVEAAVREAMRVYAGNIEVHLRRAPYLVSKV